MKNTKNENFVCIDRTYLSILGNAIKLSARVCFSAMDISFLKFMAKIILTNMAMY